MTAGEKEQNKRKPPSKPTIGPLSNRVGGMGPPPKAKTPPPKGKGKGKGKGGGGGTVTKAQEKKDIAAAEKKTKADKTQAAETADYNAIQNNPYTKEENAIGNLLTAEDPQISSAIGGGYTQAATQSATSQALADAGLSPDSSAGQWLNANLAQANANDAPMAAAMNAYQNAFTGGQTGVGSALTNEAGANALAMQTAPEQGALTQLQNRQNYNAIYGAGANYSNLPTALQFYYKNAGISNTGPQPNTAGGAAAPGAPAPVVAPGGDNTNPLPAGTPTGIYGQANPSQP
jgi:hypothetical protein